MTVIGYDTIHLNVSAIPSNAKVVLGYDTGTADIKWTPGDWSRFPRARHVHIDQGFGAKFLKTANLMDVERGTYSPSQVGEWMRDNETEDPAVYCNQSTLEQVLADGYHGRLVIAKLTTVEPIIPLPVPGCIVVAQQFEFKTAFDVDAVFDDTWPRSGVPVGEIQYDAPAHLHQTAMVGLKWDAVPAVDGKAPPSYTVAFFNTSSEKVAEHVTVQTEMVVPGLPSGTTLEVHVWANGGNIAPPHASLQVHT